MSTELLGLILIAVGILIVCLGHLWLTVRAFRTQTGWGFAVLVLVPFGGLAYLFSHFRQAVWPLAVIVLGSVVAIVPIAVVRLVEPRIDLGERNKMVNGERHLTLTGWDKTDYGLLAQYSDVVVLQMANADVTDLTLEHVRKLKGIKELDLNDTKITDVGLPALADLPNLEALRIARTGVTAEGLTKHVLTLPKLKELDVSGIPSVPPKTLRDWKNVDPMNRKYVK